MNIEPQITETPQTPEQYDDDLTASDAEIVCGYFITAEDLKIEARKW